jgi:alkanesulfonate monooxygenase SsuD/methylene tetrahydromethanopterin reductase-like flavin-dependent oxidoreductase (luciferase family)
MMGTLDVISGGRMVLGIGAGWKEDEFIAYGYPYPSTGERLRILADHLEVITRMLGPGRATFEGTHAHVRDAINLPRGLQEPRVPIMVGGNGPNVTWRLAARHADELNLDNLTPAEVVEALPVVWSRCEEIGRDPASLRVSLNIFRAHIAQGGQSRVDLLGAYKELGLHRVQAMLQAAATSDEAVESLAADARAAGLTMAA